MAFIVSCSLSKSQFLRGLQCRKSLWLYKYRPELRTPPDEALQAVFETGTEVGILARGLFPGGEMIAYEGCSFGEKLQKTRELIDNGAKTIYEATFSYDNVLVMVDILHMGEDGWEIYEVKSSTEVKDVHVSDVSVQYYVLTGCGLEISKASLVYINNEYVREGDVNIRGLFAAEDLTGTAGKRQKSIKMEIDAMLAVLDGDCPGIDIGIHCTDPYECDFRAHCWEHIPEYSIFDIANLRAVSKFALYRQGIVDLKNIPSDFKLSDKQMMQVNAELQGREYIDKHAIRAFLNSLFYPLHLLDFETFMQAVPPFDGTSPYEKIPFQYSLHILADENSRLVHHEFLAKEGTDPRKKLVINLISQIPKGACVLAYNMSFEKDVIKTLAGQLPQYASHLMAISGNMHDLIVPFRRRYYYTREMRGNASIKDVLPAAVPELSYKGMAIANGSEAMNAYSRLHLIKEKEEVKKTRKELLEYCRLDTLAMVKLLEKLRSLARCSPQ